MSRKYELIFEKDNGKDLSALSIEINNELFTDYFIDTIMRNLEYDFNDYPEFDGIVGFTLIEKESE